MLSMSTLLHDTIMTQWHTCTVMLQNRSENVVTEQRSAHKPDQGIRHICVEGFAWQALASTVFAPQPSLQLVSQLSSVCL